MRAMSIVVAAMAVVATVAVAQVSSKYADWAEGPEKFLMTQEEKAQWAALQSDDQAKAFIDLFWARRDPTGDTPRNEAREEFNDRVAVADKHFTSPRIRGSLSDPGQVLILLGPPWQIGSKGQGRSATAQGDVAFRDWSGAVGVQGPRGQSAQQVWTYGYDKKPKFIRQKEFTFTFVDEGRNDWHLARTERNNPDAVLHQAVTALIVSPKMTKAPAFAVSAEEPSRATAFRSPELKTAYEQLRAGDGSGVGSAHLTWGEFIAPEGEDLVSVQLYVPGVTPAQQLTFFGVVENASGEIVEVHEGNATLVASGPDAYVDKALALEPGTYKTTFGLASEGKVIAAKTADITVQDLDPKAPSVSPLILSNNVYVIQGDYKPTDPYTFGGLKVVPKGDVTFTPVGDLWYFLEMRNPGLSPEGTPKVQVRVDIEGQTAKGKARMNFPMAAAEAAPLKGTKERYAVGTAIPLESFIPGDYKMKIRLVDTVLEKTYDFERTFKVKEKS
jgi:GWxTD domain-containing protein